jgi:hypothetical protein
MEVRRKRKSVYQVLMKRGPKIGEISGLPRGNSKWRLSSIAPFYFHFFGKSILKNMEKILDIVNDVYHKCEI